MARRTRDWTWRRLDERPDGAPRQPRPMNYRRPDFMENAQGQMVRQHVPHPITPAIDRFKAKIKQVPVGDDYCAVWDGGETFRGDDNKITTPARFYWEKLLGRQLRDGQVLRPACKTPRCLKHKKPQ